ncbi:MAG TPA: hypothetical protein VNT30_24415 [Stellaceae bacterium]|nr:hypothetical protein [Stellaceae bacterium]
MADFVSGVGPLFGPDFVVITVNDETGTRFDVNVYPDAHNPELHQAGFPTQYYFQPAQVYLARKHDFPDDFDFVMTLFKGLGSEETSITPEELAGSTTELGGGYCTFSTTFAIPPSVIDGVIAKLKTREHAEPIPRLAPFFNYQGGDPDPGLGIVPITSSSVVCSVQDPNITGGKILMTAQYSQKGSIEEHGISTFLISCNLFAAGEIASALKAGASPPFIVINILKEAYYINGVTIVVNVDVDKVYDSFSFAVSTGSLFGIDGGTAEAAWSSCLTSGGVTTHITQNGTVLDEGTTKWVNENLDKMKQTAMDLVKAEIFDFDPSKTDSKATTSGRGWFSEIFGGTSVSLKSDHQRRSVHFSQTLILDETISVEHAVTGDLNDLLPAVRANLNKYLFVIDIGEFFKKVQVVAVSKINFSEKLPDGTDLKDPLAGAQIEVGYPDFSSPVENGVPNLRMLGEGQHYLPAQTAMKGPVSPAIWDAGTPNDMVSISFLRLDNPVPQWPKDQIKLRRKLIFDGQDPRVNLSKAIAPHDPAIAELEELSADHFPILTASAVGYIFVRFYLTQHLPSNITVTITPKIGTDTYSPIVVTSSNVKDAIWEIFSDKYALESEFSYTVQVQIDGPNFTDDPVIYSLPAPVVVPAIGPVKWLHMLPVQLPNVPADKKDIVNAYVKSATLAPV